MTRAVVASLALLSSGCVRAWAATFPTYFDVEFVDGSHKADAWICVPDLRRTEAKLYCADLAAQLEAARNGARR